MIRRLTPEERDLWDRIASTVKPRHVRHAAAPDAPDPAVSLPRHKERPRRHTVTLKPTGLRETPARHIAAPSPFTAPALDGKRAARFRKGELPVEARIDLHGLTLDLAHRALAGFLLQARERGQRVVLVITGKGGVEGGALKRLVPLWLSTPPLAATIAAMTPARPHHGGTGALYVYLRRKRA